MGIFSRYSAYRQYIALRVSIEITLTTRVKEDPEGERFSILCDVWKEAAIKLQAYDLAAQAPHYMKFPSCFGNPVIATNFTAELLAMSKVGNFKETPFMQELREGFKTFESCIREDGGLALSQTFEEMNPWGYFHYKRDYGREPFVELDAELLKQLHEASFTV